ncbi:NUDIX hydrolase domain-like protein [Cladochytrium replicatum]|nr:NUDIX hydrolase domain-like protein [Cladochytrium replicatum]
MSEPDLDRIHFFSDLRLDRAATSRADKPFIASQLNPSSNARFVPFQKLNPLFVTPSGSTKKSGPLEVGYVSYSQVSEWVDEGTLVFLGLRADGVGIWAIGVKEGANVDALVGSVERAEFMEMRPAAFRVNPQDAASLSLARAMLDWNKRYVFCSMCGEKTASEHAGWKRVCPNADCGSNKGVQNVSYPRTDSVVIACIVSKDGTRCLLGRQKSWPPRMYSCIAGFIEPSETLEAAVRREALEETSVKVDKVMYHSSQPWPFPSQLMMGCIAYAVEENIATADQELEEAKWFTKEQVLEALNHDSTIDPRSFEPQSPESLPPLMLPPKYAIAHMLVRAWAYGNVEATATGKL